MDRRVFLKKIFAAAGTFVSGNLYAGKWSLVEGVYSYSSTDDKDSASVIESNGYAKSADTRYIDAQDVEDLLKLYIPKNKGMDKIMDVSIYDKDTINYVMRDYYTNDTTNIDNTLVDLLGAIQKKVGKRRIQILSAYRTERTNKRLRRRYPGVAKHSYHIKGQAVDITVKGVSTAKLKRIAKSMNAGGVGYYPTHGFVHIDTGRIRYWNG